MAWYKVGTIAVTNGSTTVTGSGTDWIPNAQVGEALYAPDGKLYEITNVVSDTVFNILPAYLGSTASAQPYVIVPSQSYLRDLAAQAADLVNNYSTIYNTVGQGKFNDGTLAEPGIRFSADTDTGFFRSASNEVTFVAGGVAQFKYNASGISFTTSPAFTTPISVTANSTTNALRITQTGTGNALLVEDSASPDATPFVVNNDGKVVVGATEGLATTSVDNGNAASGVRVDVSGTTVTSLALTGSGSTTARFSPSVLFNRTRGTYTVPTVAVSGDYLGRLDFQGYDGTAWQDAALIYAAVDGTPGTNDMPGRLVFSTTASGSSSPTERLRIANTGLITIQNNGGLQIARTSVTAPAASDGNVFSGTYTPTLTNSANVTSSTAVVCQYMRVGNVITVSGTITSIAVTAASASTIDISLPVASSFGTVSRCAGSGAFYTTALRAIGGGAIFANTTDNRARFDFIPSAAASAQAITFSFTYLVV